MNLALAMLMIPALIFGIYCAVLVLVKLIKIITRGY